MREERKQNILYHVNAKGEVKVCGAKPGRCPFFTFNSRNDAVIASSSEALEAMRRNPTTYKRLYSPTHSPSTTDAYKQDSSAPPSIPTSRKIVSDNHELPDVLRPNTQNDTSSAWNDIQAFVELGHHPREADFTSELRAHAPFPSTWYFSYHHTFDPEINSEVWEMELRSDAIPNTPLRKKRVEIPASDEYRLYTKPASNLLTLERSVRTLMGEAAVLAKDVDDNLSEEFMYGAYNDPDWMRESRKDIMQLMYSHELLKAEDYDKPSYIYSVNGYNELRDITPQSIITLNSGEQCLRTHMSLQNALIDGKVIDRQVLALSGSIERTQSIYDDTTTEGATGAGMRILKDVDGSWSVTRIKDDYRDVVQVSTPDEMEAVVKEWTDRYYPYEPEPSMRREKIARELMRSNILALYQPALDRGERKGEPTEVNIREAHIHDFYTARLQAEAAAKAADSNTSSQSSHRGGKSIDEIEEEIRSAERKKLAEIKERRRKRRERQRHEEAEEIERLRQYGTYGEPSGGFKSVWKGIMGGGSLSYGHGSRDV